jgi:hypothetical protein
MRCLDGVKDGSAFGGRHLRQPPQVLGRPGKRAPAPFVNRLGVDGIAKVALQRGASLGGGGPDFVQILCGHVPDEHVRHNPTLSVAIA